MNDEYIKKMDITQRVLAITGEWKDGPEFWIPIDPVLGNIALLPAEDVAPVLHGRWVFAGDNMFECLRCGVVYTLQQLDGLRNYDTDHCLPNYCPNCGAKMDGGDTDA